MVIATTLSKKNGFSLKETLIALSIIGVVATISIPLVINTMNNGQQTQQAQVVENIQHLFTKKAGQEGLIPRSIAPNQIGAEALDYTEMATVDEVPEACQNVKTPATQFTLKDGQTQVYLSNSWTNSTNRTQDYTNACTTNNTGQTTLSKIMRGGKQIDIAQTNNSGDINFDSSENSQNTTTQSPIFIPKDNSTALSPNDTEVDVCYPANIFTNRSLTNVESTQSFWTDLSFVPYLKWSLDTFLTYSKFAEFAVQKIQQEDAPIDLVTHTKWQAFSTRKAYMAILMFVKQFGYDYHPVDISFSNQDWNNYGRTITYNKNFMPLINGTYITPFTNYNNSGNQLPDLTSLTLPSNSPLSNFTNSSYFAGYAMFQDANGQLAKLPLEQFMLMSNWDNKSNFMDSIWNNDNWKDNNWVGDMAHNPPEVNWGTYTDNTKKIYKLNEFQHGLHQGTVSNLTFSHGGKNYCMANGVGFSPIKIGLNKQSVQVDSTNQFLVELDGFKKDTFPIIKTTGGITKDEAWLALDRGQAGFYREDVLDGDDIFGDHLAKFPSGYEDLQQQFKNQLHIDREGKAYIELKQLNWFEKLWIQLCRFITGLFGVKHDIDINYDLKLLTQDHQVLFASDYASKIYTSYINVKEFDESGKNSIRQRAKVVYIDGSEATSGDVWFSENPF